jgi:hypothetical protein
MWSTYKPPKLSTNLVVQIEAQWYKSKTDAPADAEANPTYSSYCNVPYSTVISKKDVVGLWARINKPYSISFVWSKYQYIAVLPRTDARHLRRNKIFRFLFTTSGRAMLKLNEYKIAQPASCKIAHTYSNYAHTHTVNMHIMAE